MKAWRFYGFNDMRLDEVPDPVRREGHVIAEILCVQPSVTEAQLAYGIPTLAYEQIKYRLETEAPIRLYSDTSSAPESWNPIRIHNSVPETVWQPAPSYRAANAPSVYQSVETTAAGVRLSAFSCPAASPSSLVLPEIALTKVDDRISDSEAACLQSLSDSLAAVDTAEIHIGDTVAIFGQGSMGLECMQVARASGAGQLITVDVREEACQVSVELGADHSIDASQDDPVEVIQTLTDGNGADVVFECAGGSPKQGLVGDERRLHKPSQLSGPAGN